MKAMILAAGLGTRLRPLTVDRPKALVEIAGRTLLEITLARLRDAGIKDVIINAHHFAGMIVDYLNHNQNFGMDIEVSVEESLLDTGGGLKQAAHFFLKSPGRDEPFILHNVDVITTIDINSMVQLHIERKAVATLAVQERIATRYLLFDEDSKLCGRKFGEDLPTDLLSASAPAHALAFCGVHVISPRFLAMITEQGAFSIITPYLRLAALGEKIIGFRADEYYWRDVGSPEKLCIVAEDLRSKA